MHAASMTEVRDWPQQTGLTCLLSSSYVAGRADWAAHEDHTGLRLDTGLEEQPGFEDGTGLEDKRGGVYDLKVKQCTRVEYEAH